MCSWLLATEHFAICLQFLSFLPAMQHWVSDYNVHFNRVLLTATYAFSPCPAL